MKVDIIFTADEVSQEKTKGKICVVIDVLRATSVMITALHNGAEKIFPFKDIKIIQERCENLKNIIKCGERNALKIDGFDLGNSPLEFTKEKVFGKDIYMSTTNGTKAVENSLSAEKIIICSFLNIKSVSKKLLEYKKDVVIVCAGTNGKFSLDDTLCAGLIIKEMQKHTEIQMNDVLLAAVRISESHEDIKDILKGSTHYERLLSLGFEKDMEHIFSLNKYSIVPEYKNGYISIK
ncbi:MAG: 2-phosphosulfolactate phosphatase [Fusobacterium sp.]|nr:2-phosphosulfolactate phosphatase [Fusobacterium sp.]